MNTTPSDAAGTLALTDLYHGWLTGLVLATSLHEGPDAAGDMIFKVYRRHHENRFLSSFDKLGLSGLPHAVACARYHYLSNSIGGVRVEYMEESPRKAWVRFAYPRWIYEGSALCGVPVSVSRGMLKGWYGQNGVSLKNDRLAFVCTSEDMGDGYGLAGYFIERDEPVGEKGRLVFSLDERPPPFEPAKAPVLDPSAWTEERLVKARLTYSVDPVKLALLAMAELFGRSRTEEIASRAARIIGLQSYAAVATAIADVEAGAQGYLAFHATLGACHGDQFDLGEDDRGPYLEQRGWRFGRGLDVEQDLVARCWAALWSGLATSHDRNLVLVAQSLPIEASSVFRWRVKSA